MTSPKTICQGVEYSYIFQNNIPLVTDVDKRLDIDMMMPQ